MRLKSFSAYGFKSFADKTELTFDKGITAVVGPNGSGKSNISDAIRWALGEQSARYLRGAKMEDVIFSGSSRRRALGVAEVNLEFDNSDHTLPLDFEQVLLTRRIFRSGDSEYALNKKPCRLKDIVDLMADTGLGKGSMSIIGQNKIDELLNSRPEERRGLFEEAAGIAKYRLRKKDAVRRLDDTAANLTRISDIRSEVEAQVEPLAQAAARTSQYNDLSGELRLCRMAELLRRLDAAAGAQAALQEKRTSAAEEFSRQAAALSGREADAVSLQRDLDKLAEEYSQLQELVSQKETELEKLRGRQGVLAERREQSCRAQARLEQNNAGLEQQAGELEQRMRTLAAEFDAVDKQRAGAALLTEQLQQERDGQAQLLERTQSESAAAQSSFFADMQALLKLRNELHALEQLQEQRMRRREALKKNIEEAESALARLEEQYGRLLEAQAANGHTLELLQKNAAELQEHCRSAQQRSREISGRQQQCQRLLTAAETRANSLRRLQSAYEGFGYGIRAVLKAEEPWRQQLLGVAAELIRVEPRYVTAVETALGEAAQHIVAVTADAAKAAIAHLKRIGGGRATFLPLDTVQRRAPGREELALASLPGICGYATDLLQYEPAAENAIRFLLGRVLIAENMDAALAAARASRFRLRVVTLDGDVVNTGGSMSGGSRRQKEGYLTRELEISRTEEEARRLHRELLELQEQLEALEEEQQQHQRRLQANNEQEQQHRLKSSELKLQLQQALKSRQQENESLSLLMDDRRQAAEEYLADRDRVKALRTSVSECEGRDTEAKARLEQLQQEIARQGSRLTALENRLQDARVTLETSAAKSRLMSERMQGLDQDTLQVRRNIAANQEEIAHLQRTAEQCAAQKQELAERESALLAELRSIMGGKDAFSEQRGQLLARQRELEEELTAARRRTSACEALLRQTELELARRESDYQHMLEQLQQDYGLDAEQARREDLSSLEGLELKELQRRGSSLALKIAELGPINAAAIEEYAAVKERSEFLRRQYEDLCSARDKLEAVIGELNSGMTRRFKEAFAKINEYFAQCYVRLFGGGTALLKLTEPADLLGSGIEIEVQPPGKKLQSLYLMSGGERALTVIALLFALLSYQPSPFCILDEIDAALDDANIQRFAGFLRDYASQTQFIVITHRKGTMECADIMYGVTMEESGVSKLLSVRINAKER